MKELERLMTQCQGQIAAHVLFYKPAEAPNGWAMTELWEHASSIRGVTAHLDVDGLESKHFGAFTSGHALLYAASGELTFSGGITVSRGHEGDNPGRSAIADQVLQGTRGYVRGPVFGCPITAVPLSPATTPLQN
ncbi:MAG: hypothetical protein ACI835_002864 [Planctomycetota bacterium]|jgi:hypothetical protein